METYYFACHGLLGQSDSNRNYFNCQDKLSGHFNGQTEGFAQNFTNGNAA
jgi:hypothetical protein